MCPQYCKTVYNDQQNLVGMWSTFSLSTTTSKITIFPCFNHLLYYFAQTGMAKYYRVHDFNKRNLFLTSVEAGTSKMKVPAS